MQNSPPPTNTLKIYLHIEQFSLKTNRRQAKRILYSQGCKKDPHRSGRKGRETIRSEPGPLGRDKLRGRDHTDGDLPWGVGSSSRILGAPVLGSDKGNTSPLGRLGGWWD